MRRKVFIQPKKKVLVVEKGGRTATPEQVKRQIMDGFNWNEAWKVQQSIGDVASYGSARGMRLSTGRMIDHILSDFTIDFISTGQFTVRKCWDTPYYYYELEYTPLSSNSNHIHEISGKFAK